jgi:hypothetical protein
MTVVFLGRHLDEEPDDRAPVHVPRGESLEVGSKPGNPFARDPFVARYHAALSAQRDGVVVEDFGTTNGVYLRVVDRLTLRDGDRIRLGRQLLRLARDTRATAPGAWAHLGIMLDPYREATSVPLMRAQVVLGRCAGDVAFPTDASVGQPHCTIALERGAPVLHVASGDPPTYVRVERGDMVPYGSELLVGETRVRLDR